MGPIILFDKSTLQSLSIDEAVWLDAHYLTNITPLFFVETLADLEKEVQAGRTPEQVVGNLAVKTPDGAMPNVHHITICLNELLGVSVEMRGVPAVAGGKPVESGGRRGIVFDEWPQVAALKRWRAGRFLEVEREFARVWRNALSGLDLETIYREGRDIIQRYGRPRDLGEAKALAAALHRKPGSRSTREALQGLLVAPEDRGEVFERWKAAGEPPIEQYAPFTSHVLIVDSFFTVAMGADLISRERPSNKVDIAYLYYLPFCMVFTSGDNLHARIVPLFLGSRQAFVRADELKADLAKLDAHYSALPEEVKQRGVLSFAHYPPTEGNFLTSRLWDMFMRPEWREHARGAGEFKLSKEEEKELIAEISKMAGAPRVTPDSATEESDAALFKHTMPARKGKWRLLPPEVEEGHSTQNQGSSA